MLALSVIAAVLAEFAARCARSTTDTAAFALLLLSAVAIDAASVARAAMIRSLPGFAHKGPFAQKTWRFAQKR